LGAHVGQCLDREWVVYPSFLAPSATLPFSFRLDLGNVVKCLLI
jgi:hypothetical protein